jgi:phytoene dehydrogenase-like protein
LRIAIMGAGLSGCSIARLLTDRGHDAVLLEKLWADGKRLKPREVVAEFRKHLGDELDLIGLPGAWGPAAIDGAQDNLRVGGLPTLDLPYVVV